MSDYEKKLEAQNEELQKKLAKAEEKLLCVMPVWQQIIVGNILRCELLINENVIAEITQDGSDYRLVIFTKCQHLSALKFTKLDDAMSWANMVFTKKKAVQGS